MRTPSPDTLESPKKSSFPDPDTLEPKHTSPETQLVEELEQAPIFQDVTEPTETDHKGKSKEGYLPLSSLPLQTYKPYLASLLWKTTPRSMMASTLILRKSVSQSNIGIPQVNLAVTFSQFAQASAFAPLVQRNLPLGF